MKTNKHLLLAVTSTVMALILSFAVGCSCQSCKRGGEEPEDSKVLQSISLSTENAKTEFFTGDDFSASGLVITATFKVTDADGVRDETENITVSNSIPSGVTVDSSSYVKRKVGAYSIKVSYKYEDETKDASYTVKVSSVTLSVDDSAVQTLYLVNEDDFNATGLKVYRTETKANGDVTTVEVPSGSYTINNATAFKGDTVGEYTITVSNVYNGKTLNASYVVNVIEPRYGLDVKLRSDYLDKETTTLSSSLTSADLSGYENWIEVRQPDRYGVVAPDAEVLDAQDYSVELWLGDEKLNSAAGLTGGAYAIVVTKEGKDNAGEDITYVGQRKLFVVDPLEKIELNSSSVTTQELGVDVMTPNWTYIATYASGRTQNLTAGDVTVGTPDTLNVTTSAKSVTATYNHFNAKGVLESKYVTVQYTITNNGGKTVSTKTFSYSALQTAIKTVEDVENLSDLIALGKADADKSETDADKIMLKAGYFTGDNSFLTLLAENAANQYRGTSGNSCIEIKDDALRVTLQGVGIISVSFASTGGSNESRIALKDSDGNYIKAASFSGATEVLVDDGDGSSHYEYSIVGTSAVTATFNIMASGNYTICSPSETTTRGARISAISVTDIYSA